MRLFLTGGTGFIGQALVRAVRRRGWSLSVLVRATFARWRRYPGGTKAILWLPRWLMWPMMASLEPLERALRLPAFLSRDTVRVTRAHLSYDAGKARRELGWTHPAPDEMWDRIVAEERALMARRQGFLERLRHQPVVEG